MCVFCKIPQARIISENFQAIAVYDFYPVTPGHTLVIPRIHEPDYFDLPPGAQWDMLSLIKQVRFDLMQDDPTIKGFNIGINIGVSAGQTVHHCHVHVIPRRLGDMKDPRGGVRGVIPEKQKY